MLNPKTRSGYGLIQRAIKDFKLLFALIKDYRKGNYRNVSPWSVLVFFFGLFYLVWPLDFLPDTIPVIGQIDDVTILFLCMFLLEKDLYKYQSWKMEKEETL